MPKIIYYRENCIGCSMCQERQPGLWRMSKKDGKAVLLQSIQKKKIHQLQIHEASLQEMREVAQACPAAVIKICWADAKTSSHDTILSVWSISFQASVVDPGCSDFAALPPFYFWLKRQDEKDECYSRTGRNHFPASSMLIAFRCAKSSNWSFPIFPTPK